MESRVALITGGARGIGKALALRLRGEGWRVAVCHRGLRPETAAQAAELEAEGALVIAADVSEPEACQRLVGTVEEALGRIDALVHAAGPFHRVPLLEETSEGWRAAFDHNLHPVFELTRRCADGMRARGWGRVLTFGMANADRLQGQEQVTAYYAAKVALLVLTRSFARALAPHGITVNAISPGFVDTGGLGGRDLEAMAPRIPAGRRGSPEDVLGVARFLLSDEASYVNGANVAVSGAWGV